MIWLIPALIACTAGTIILAAVYIYLYYSERKHYILLWAVSWIVYFLRFLAMLMDTFLGGTVLLSGLYLVLAVISTIILTLGTLEYIGKQKHLAYLILGGIIVFWIIVAKVFGFSFLALTLPPFAFMGIAYIYTGITFNRANKDVKPMGFILGIIFVLWGVHKLDYPFTRNIDWFAPTGYIIGEMFAMMIAVGMLVMYFQITKTSLLASEERFQMLFNKAPLGYQSLDVNGKFIEVNQKWLDLLGYDRYEVIGKWFGDFLSPEYREAFRQRFPIFKEKGEIHSEFLMLSKKGMPLFIAFEGKIGLEENGRFKQTHCILQDITEKKKAQDALRESESKYRTYIENAPDGVFVADEKGRYVEVNRAACETTGYSQEELLNMSIRDTNPELFSGDNIEAFEQLKGRGLSKGIYQYIHKNGSCRWWSVDAVKLCENRFLSFVKDITDWKEAEEKLYYLSYHDQLTDLYNRRFFEKEIERLDTPHNYPLSIIIGDLNGLKLINDSFGHSAGDELLIEAARAIKHACSTNDIVARYGGDEFIVILPHTDEYEVHQIIKRIEGFIENKKVRDFEISISFGHETKHSDGKSIRDLLSSAENHMYRHKLSERGSMRSKFIDVIMTTLFEKSKRESLHSKRVSELCGAIASCMNLSKDEINQIIIAGLVHDIGKIGVDEKILNKPGSLTDEERQAMQMHPENGWRILSATSEFLEIAQSVRDHHERWDGNGYPNGLKGEAIPLEARIIAIADSFDAMSYDRPYRKGLSKAEAVEEIKRCAGNQFDPDLANKFLKILSKKGSFNL